MNPFRSLTLVGWAVVAVVAAVIILGALAWVF